MGDDIDSLAYEFVELAGAYIRGLELHLCTETLLRRYISHFGISPRHTAFVWYFSVERLQQTNNYIEKVHLLWTLNLLKTDETENVLKGHWGADEKRIRKWLYVCLGVLGNLGVVSTCK